MATLLRNHFFILSLCMFAFAGQARAAVSTADQYLMRHVIFGDFKTNKVLETIEASTNPSAQELVDSGMREILKSELARSVFCTFGQTPELGINNFSLSPKMAGELVETCRANKTPIEHVKNTEDLKHIFPRNIVFVRSSEPARVESWTSNLGTIFIFSTDQRDRYKLVRTLIHEYFVAFDELYSFAGDNAHYLSRSTFKARGKANDVKAYLKAFSAPLIRGTLQMVRALYFENQILAEIVGQSTPEKRTAPCWDIAKAVSLDILDLQDLFVGAFMLVSPSEDRLAAWGGPLPVSAFDYIIELEKKAKTNGSLCDLLSRPIVGFTSMAVSNGPRPRIGSGTQSRRKQTLDLNVKLEKGERLQSELFAQDLLKRELPFSFPPNQIRSLPELKIELHRLPQ